MSTSLTDLSVKGTTVVTADGVAARQVEGHLARQRLEEGRPAWLAPIVQNFRDWTATMWRRHVDDGSRQLLSSGQAAALWRRVIDESDVGLQGFPGYRHVSVWAREASRRRREWNIDFQDLYEFRDDPDCRVFLRWERAYRNALDDAGWLDSKDVVDMLAAWASSSRGRESGSMVWADFAPTPAQSSLAGQLQDAGFRCSVWTAPTCARRCRRVRLSDAAEEVRAAAAWAAARFERQSRQRVAIIVPGLETRRDEVVTALEDALTPAYSRLGAQTVPRRIVCLQGQSTAMDNPVIGAAMNALELFSGAGDFRVLSRWLRSPYFSAADRADARCMLEAQLRPHISSQMTFLDAYRSGGLARPIRAAMPTLADELGAAMSLIDARPRRATLTTWVSIWRRLLGELGWCRHGSTVPEDWESAVNDLMLLTPILDRLDLSDALSELERILACPQRLGALPLYGIFLLADPQAMGPGYDAAWVCGLADTRWPQASQPIPLLPLALQRRCGMPAATPAAALDQSRVTMRRLVDRVPDVVLSSPETVHEHSVQPSPLILSYPSVTEADLLRGRVRRSQGTALDGSRLETCADPVPPVDGRKLGGGVGTLSMHSICPLRAFIESRLHAKPLESVRPGFSARHRGIAVHAAVRHLFGEWPDQSEILSWSPQERYRRIDQSCDRSLRGLFGGDESRLGTLFELELAKLRSMLTRLLEMESTREPFQVVALEHAIEVVVGGLRINGRVDRIDKLGPSGPLAVIDYKTGTRHSPRDWLKERPRDLQLPFYASFLEGQVEAVMIVMLDPASPEYKGFWLGDERFPGQAAKLPTGLAWSMQLERWRKRIEYLAGEFAQGDGRVFWKDIRYADGVIAPLTRVHECAALARKAQP